MQADFVREGIDAELVGRAVGLGGSFADLFG